MKKRLALAAASAATIAMMAGPAALTVSAHDTDTDVRAEAGWVNKEHGFKGRFKAKGRFQDGDREGRRGQKGLYRDLLEADLDESQRAEVRAALEAKHASLIEAMRAKFDAQLAAMEARQDAVADAWTIEDKDERKAALEEVRETAKEDRKDIRSTFRASMKSALETFTSTIKDMLGIE